MNLREIARGRRERFPRLVQELRPGNPPVLGNYRLEHLSEVLPRWIEAADQGRRGAAGVPSAPLLLVAWLPWWLEYALRWRCCSRGRAPMSTWPMSRIAIGTPLPWPSASACRPTSASLQPMRRL